MHVHSAENSIEWVGRSRERRLISATLDPVLYDEVVAYADSVGLKVTQLIRYSLAREIRYGNLQRAMSDRAQ
jgi:hypothetical protein